MYRGRCVVSSPLAQRAARDDLIARRDRQIKSKDAKSQMSEDTLSEDEADLHKPNSTPSNPPAPPRRPGHPKRKARDGEARGGGGPGAGARRRTCTGPMAHAAGPCPTGG